MSIRLLILSFLASQFFPTLCTSDSLPINENDKTAVVDKVAAIMAERYFDAAAGDRMAQHIRSRHAQGEYRDSADVESFCSALTADLRSVSQDKHLFVFRSPNEAREVAAQLGMLSDEEAQSVIREQLTAARRSNFGLQKVEILKGNIGYLKLNYFPGAEGKETISAAMAFLSHTDAIMVDLRDNGGGEKPVFLISYFFPAEEIELTGSYYRGSDSVTRSWTLSHVPGKRMPDVDLYVLTSSRTFSAAEDFAYTLQSLKRATVIGERTKGGAHPVEVLIVQGDILTQVAVGESVNPITGTNWEGTGVNPDHQVSAEQAPLFAHRLAAVKLLESTSDIRQRKVLESMLHQ